MERRKFIKTSLAGSAFGLSNCAVKIEGEGPARNEEQGKLAGLSLEQLRDSYRYYLFEDFLPFMEKYVIDHQYGGFMCNTDRDGTNLSGNKLAWFEGRGIWVYSFLYNNFARNEKHLEVARKSLQFILRLSPSGEDTLSARVLLERENLSPLPRRPSTGIFLLPKAWLSTLGLAVSGSTGTWRNESSSSACEFTIALTTNPISSPATAARNLSPSPAPGFRGFRCCSSGLSHKCWKCAPTRRWRRSSPTASRWCCTLTTTPNSPSTMNC